MNRKVINPALHTQQDCHQSGDSQPFSALKHSREDSGGGERSWMSFSRILFGASHGDADSEVAVGQFLF